MKAIIYTRPDGGLSIVSPAEGARLAISVDINGQSLGPYEPRPVDSIVRGWPVTGAVAQWAESEEQFLARIIAKDVPAAATNVKVIDPASLPDRTFRNAWKHDTGSVVVDLTKAREIHRERLRQMRAPLFAKYDAAWMKCLASGDAAGANAAEAKRIELRDALQDPVIDAAKTADELKVAVPACLL